MITITTMTETLLQLEQKQKPKTKKKKPMPDRRQFAAHLNMNIVHIYSVNFIFVVHINHCELCVRKWKHVLVSDEAQIRIVYAFLSSLYIISERWPIKMNRKIR